MTVSKKTPPKKDVPAAKKPAAKTAKTTALVPWEAEMKAKAQLAKQAERLQSLTKKIGTRNCVLTIDDEAVEDNELIGVVIGAVHENQYYDKPFDPKNPTVPVCYSFSEPDSLNPDDGMAPNAEAEGKQGDDNGLCANCWANQWRSADTGKGKACKNIRRLALAMPDALESADDLRDAEVRMLNVPVMSTNNWSKYVHKLSDEVGRTHWGVLTKIKLVPDEDSQFRIQFSFEELITFDQDLWSAMEAKRAEVNQAIVAPYPKQSELDAQNEKPVRPQGRLAQKMARKVPGKPAAKKAAPGAKAKKF